MPRLWTALALALVACSGAAKVASVQEPESEPPVTGLGTGAADAAAAARLAVDGASPVDAALTPDPGIDSSADAGADAGTDAGADSALPVDAAADADVDADADTPPPPPPFCAFDGATRCHDYKLETCNLAAMTWDWQVGDQSCCHDSRFTVAGATVVDSKTGRTWSRYGGMATVRSIAGSACTALFPGGWLAKATDLAAIEIGPPDMNTSVCSPTIDQVAFQGVFAGETFTAGGECVDLSQGITKASCTPGATVGYLCIAP